MAGARCASICDMRLVASQGLEFPRNPRQEAYLSFGWQVYTPNRVTLKYVRMGDRYVAARL
jgi:hypothetical protein